MDVDLEKIIQGRMALRQSPDSREAVRAFDVKSVDLEKRRVTGIASSEIIDRDGEIVTIAALRQAMKEYMKNPVILATHMHRTSGGHSPVVGTVVEWRIANKKLWITVEFAKTELGEEYWTLYRDKIQRAFSIGFRIKKSKDEMIEGRRVFKITEIDLYEISCVPVPANPEALTKAKQRKQEFVNQKRSEKLPEGWDEDEELCYVMAKERDPQLTRQKWYEFSRQQAEEFAWAFAGYKLVNGEYVETNEFDITEDDWITNEDDRGEDKTVECPDYAALFDKKKGNRP